jgi:hypothetical protein
MRFHPRPAALHFEIKLACDRRAGIPLDAQFSKVTA